MGFTQSYGPFLISEVDGKFKVSIAHSMGVGGGVLNAQLSASAIVDGAILANAGMAWLAAKYPILSKEIQFIQAHVDEELAKL